MLVSEPVLLVTVQLRGHVNKFFYKNQKKTLEVGGWVKCHANVNNGINALLCLCSCFYVQISVVNYFLDFPEFVLDRGVGGWGVSYPNFFGFLYFFNIYKAPKPYSL